jgi:hypothetical protein
MLVTAATLGWGDAAELRRIEPNDLLAAAFVAQMSARLDAKLAFESESADAVSLELWYPPVPATRRLDVAGRSLENPRRDITYDPSLPYLRAKP